MGRIALQAHGCVLAMTICGAAMAQQRPPLPDPDEIPDGLALDVFLANNNPTAFEFNVGTAIQDTCFALANFRGAATNPDPQERDLFLRCGELVQTAAQLNSGQSTNVRELGFNAGELLRTLDQYAAEELVVVGDLTTQAQSGQNANIAGRLNALRFGAGVAASRGRVASLDSRNERNRSTYAAKAESQDGATRAMSRDILPYGALLSDGETREASAEAAPSQTDQPFGWFFETSYNFGDQDGSDREAGFDYEAGSLTLGFDYVAGSAVVGMSIGHDSYTADSDVFGAPGLADQLIRGEVTIEGVSTSGYAAWFGERLSFSAIATYGEPESDIERQITYNDEGGSTCSVVDSGNPADAACGTDRRLNAKPGAQFFSVGASATIDFDLGSWDFAPSLSYSVRNVDIDAFFETDVVTQAGVDDGVDGGLALEFGEQAIDSERLIAGFELSRPLSRGFGVLTPIIRAEYHHEFEDEARSVEAKFKNLVGDAFGPDCISCFDIPTNFVDQDFGLVGAGLTFLFPNRVQGYLYAETLIEHDYLTSGVVALGVRGQF